MGLIIHLCGSFNVKKIVVVVTVVRLVVGWAGRSDRGTGKRRQWELLKRREGVRGRAQRFPRNAN